MFETEGENKGTAADANSQDQEDEIPSVEANSSDPSSGVCPICHETFDQFFNHKTDDWHYKYAKKVGNLNYHPFCHEDHMKVIWAAFLL